MEPFIKTTNISVKAFQKTVFLPIRGMTCASCVGRLERHLTTLDGVQSVSVNLTTERASINFNPDLTGPNKFIEAITKIGFTVPSLDLNNKSGEEEDPIKLEINSLRRNVIFAAAFTAPLFFISLAKMTPGIDKIATLLSERGWVTVEFFLATPLIYIAWHRFFKSGWAELRHLSPGMNSLVMLGASSAYIYSLVGLVAPELFPTGTNNSYFKATGIIITLILIGRYLEASSKRRTSQAIKKMVQIQIKTARVLRESREFEILIEDIVVGDLVCVRPGECLAVDGIVINGSSYIDESMISGEPTPVKKSSGSIVTGGTINMTGAFTFQALRIGPDMVLSKLICMVKDAQNSKPPIQLMADKIASVFVPAVIGISIITFGVWIILGPAPTLNYAFINSVSVLLIACPCAIGLAAPTAVMVGTGRGAELGVLFRKGSSLETLSNIDTLLLDKTGTITKGLPELTNFITLGKNKTVETLRLISAAETLSEHPIANAIVMSAQKKNLDIPRPKNFIADPGFGIDAIVEGHSVQVGSERYMKRLGIDLRSVSKHAAELSKLGRTTLFGLIDGKLAALIAVADTLKDDSRVSLSMLQKMGLKTIMVTGDNRVTSQAIADEVGIGIVLAEALPEEKAEEIKRLQAKGKKIAFVGDGINDTPALAQADIGIAIGTGTDIAIETGDVILMSGNLNSLVNSILLARRTMAIIRLNFFWAYAYNIALIPIAAGVLFPFLGVLLNPMLAAGAMSLSSFFVITNSLRLRRFQASAAS